MFRPNKSITSTLQTQAKRLFHSRFLADTNKAERYYVTIGFSPASHGRHQQAFALEHKKRFGHLPKIINIMDLKNDWICLVDPKRNNPWGQPYSHLTDIMRSHLSGHFADTDFPTLTQIRDARYRLMDTLITYNVAFEDARIANITQSATDITMTSATGKILRFPLIDNEGRTLCIFDHATDIAKPNIQNAHFLSRIRSFGLEYSAPIDNHKLLLLCGSGRNSFWALLHTPTSVPVLLLLNELSVMPKYLAEKIQSEIRIGRHIDLISEKNLHITELSDQSYLIEAHRLMISNTINADNQTFQLVSAEINPVISKRVMPHKIYSSLGIVKDSRLTQGLKNIDILRVLGNHDDALDVSVSRETCTINPFGSAAHGAIKTVTQFNGFFSSQDKLLSTAFPHHWELEVKNRLNQPETRKQLGLLDHATLPNAFFSELNTQFKLIHREKQGKPSYEQLLALIKDVYQKHMISIPWDALQPILLPNPCETAEKVCLLHAK